MLPIVKQPHRSTVEDDRGPLQDDTNLYGYMP